MKKYGLAAMLILGSFGTFGLQAEDFYQPIPYYNNDVFTFCMYGMPSHCWLPLDPGTGSYTVTNPKCFNASSAAMFANVCPKAFNGYTEYPLKE